MVERNALTGGHWPPKPSEAFHGTFDPWGLPLVNTLILLTSGTTVTWAHHALLENNRKGLVWGLVLTVILGVLFTACQAYEYAHAGFKFAGHIYGSTFFMATGFHGAHVIIGTLFLIVCLFRALAGHFTPKQHFGFEAAAWYWHFVDVVWLFLFICIYVWGAGMPAAALMQPPVIPEADALAEAVRDPAANDETMARSRIALRASGMAGEEDGVGSPLTSAQPTSEHPNCFT